MRRVILAIVSTVTAMVMLLSFKTHAVTSAATPPTAVSGTNSGSTSGSTGSSGTTRGNTTSTTKTSSTSKTVTGNAVDTMYGPVQVRITVRNGSLISATAIEYPETDPRDAQINAYAIPALNQEAKQAGSANINHVSGATYTSDGYIQSLQSALDKAGM